jgi:hypothetical protein
MPITTFSSVTDGLDANRRSREHFTANIDVRDQRRWVPYADGVWFQPCCFNVTSGGFSVVLKGMPGAKLGVHYHVGTVRAYEDGFSILDLCRKYYREAGLDVAYLDSLIR